MYIYHHQIRVRYGDTDQMGYVYYGNYGYYYEQARVEAMRAVGISYKDMEASGTMMPITRMTTKYIWPAYYDELLTIKTILPSMPNRIITFLYEVRNEKNELFEYYPIKNCKPDLCCGKKTNPFCQPGFSGLIGLK